MEQISALLAVSDLEVSLQVESLSLAGRISEDRYAETRTPALPTQYATESAAWYTHAHALISASFPSINAATMALLAGQPQQAVDLATQAAQRATAEQQQPDRAQDDWLLATLGEACLHLGQYDAAAEWYTQAVAQAHGRLGDLATMRRQLQRLAEPLALDPTLLALVNVGHVVVFSGHMIDHPSRQTPRFPPDAAREASVRAALTQALTDLDAAVGYSAVACGADILFAEAMLERGKELHIVLPFRYDDFYATSVDFGLESMAGWCQRCDYVLAHAEVHYATTQPFLGEESLYDFVNTLTPGLVITRAAHLGVPPYALVVRDPTSPERPGGTAYFVRSWQDSGQRLAPEINLAALRAALPALPPVATRPVPSPLPTPLPRVVKVMLFGDVKNCSKLGDEQMPNFLTHIFDQVADMVAQTQPRPAFANTWGDGLFLVFDSVRDCARFALPCCTGWRLCPGKPWGYRQIPRRVWACMPGRCIRTWTKFSGVRTFSAATSTAPPGLSP